MASATWAPVAIFNSVAAILANVQPFIQPIAAWQVFDGGAHQQVDVKVFGIRLHDHVNGHFSFARVKAPLGVNGK